MEMNEFLEIISIMYVNEWVDPLIPPCQLSNIDDFDSVDPCSFLEFSIIFSIFQSVENWDTGIPSFRFTFLANYETLIFFCHIVDFQ